MDNNFDPGTKQAEGAAQEEVKNDVAPASEAATAESAEEGTTEG